jgi:hypothetical protein
MTLPVPMPGSFYEAKQKMQQKMFDNMRSYTSVQGIEGLWNVMYAATGAVPVDIVDLTPESRKAMAATWSSDPFISKIIGQNSNHRGAALPTNIYTPYMFFLGCPHSKNPPPTVRECEIAASANSESISHAILVNAREPPPPVPIAYIPGSRKKMTPEKKSEKKKTLSISLRSTMIFQIHSPMQLYEPILKTSGCGSRCGYLSHTMLRMLIPPYTKVPHIVTCGTL